MVHRRCPILEVEGSGGEEVWETSRLQDTFECLSQITVLSSCLQRNGHDFVVSTFVFKFFFCIHMKQWGVYWVTQWNLLLQQWAFSAHVLLCNLPRRTSSILVTNLKLAFICRFIWKLAVNNAGNLILEWNLQPSLYSDIWWESSASRQIMYL